MLKNKKPNSFQEFNDKDFLQWWIAHESHIMFIALKDFVRGGIYRLWNHL